MNIFLFNTQMYVAYVVLKITGTSGIKEKIWKK